MMFLRLQDTLVAASVSEQYTIFTAEVAVLRSGGIYIGLKVEKAVEMSQLPRGALFFFPVSVENKILGY
jgi:hypothetical protein